MKTLIVVLAVLVQILTFSTRESIADTGFEKFYGHYVGSSINEVPNRGIDVVIKPHQSGFNVTWTTTEFRAANKIKESTFSINFNASRKAGVYGSAMKKDLFGHETPLNPLNGDPYVWAFIDGETMTVNSLLVSENGGYEIQTYERTLTGNGMSLVFSRVQNGKVMKQIHGSMKKVK